MPPHILAVFNQLYEELKSMRQQQWTITTTVHWSLPPSTRWSSRD